ncbi:MAG: glutamate-5-semialdehyde dehydrogenase [Bavariicoccus seileri]|uniref:glutamate-5-semialdehyde dehydrogenase n=1 Tax=Bavariicoccus seileri TaxID=549685 RepID=UPI0003B3A10A|nr:glutamate-5-semialdehyde dehydrogenase [Bavariicoccus seileri]
MTDLQQLGKRAKEASTSLQLSDTRTKNRLLNRIANDLLSHESTILATNRIDVDAAEKAGVPAVKRDRLQLTPERLKDMAEGIQQVASLPDPIGDVTEMWQNEADLTIGIQRVPLGVIGIIYESRPNVTTDAASLCLKTGNAVILRGSREALHSNKALVTVIQDALTAEGANPYAVQLVTDPSHEIAEQLMHLTDYLDVLIPRGGAGLIKRVKETATVPVIETGTGNNHVYVDQSAQIPMAANIILNAKAQRPSVCNAIETIVLHQAIAEEALPEIEKALLTKNVELRADERALPYLKTAVLATEEDFKTEFLDYILAVKVVDSIDEAIAHINHYGTKHSEAIITDDYFASQKFLKEIDAAAVYVNASTRFTDGYEFGFGAEIGISTQKLHARGPMGLAALTSSKYIIYGDGQIRE